MSFLPNASGSPHDRIPLHVLDARLADEGRCVMTGLRVYISGPMTGRPALNAPAFFAAAHALRAAGHIPVNPVEVCALIGATEWTDCMRADIKALCDCDAIALLPGWEMSQGAQLELHIAHRLGLAIGPLETYIGREQVVPNNT